ncbi:Putative ribonuclease H protein At1g65750 [Linum perenne]
MTNIMDIINGYGAITGEEINRTKSSVFFSKNTPDSIRADIIGVANFQGLADHSKYLGVPTEWGRSKGETFNYLIERMEKQGQAWKGLLLSHAGKMTLLKAVIQAIPTYIMSLFLLPKKMINQMNSLLRMFFWSGSMTKKAIHWCKGSKLCDSKSSRGVGFKEFGMFNTALLARQGWRLLNQPDTLWAKLLKSLYFPSGDFLTASKGRRPSWVWSSLIHGRSTLKLEWDDHLIRSICSPEVTEAIMKIPIGPRDFEDFWAWKYDILGWFSVRSAYHAAKNALLSPPDRANANNEANWKWLGNLSIPPKVTFFIWRGANNCLATNTNLMIRKCSRTPICPLCDQEESIIHCLFYCPHARGTWSILLPSLLPPVAIDFRSWLFSLRGRLVPTSWALVAAGCWNIWKARNDFVFNNFRPLASMTAS